MKDHMASSTIKQIKPGDDIARSTLKIIKPGDIIRRRRQMMDSNYDDVVKRVHFVIGIKLEMYPGDWSHVTVHLLNNNRIKKFEGNEWDFYTQWDVVL